MTRKTLILSILILLPTILFAQLKVGIMNPQEVLEALPETQLLQGELEQFINDKEDEFAVGYAEWIEAITEYQESVESNRLNQQQRLAEEERLAEMEDQLGVLQQRLQIQIQEKRNQLLEPLLMKIEDAMESVAEELGLDFVINKATSAGDPIVYYASQRSVDITQRVINKLTSN